MTKRKNKKQQVPYGDQVGFFIRGSWWFHHSECIMYNLEIGASCIWVFAEGVGVSCKLFNSLQRGNWC